MGTNFAAFAAAAVLGLSACVTSDPNREADAAWRERTEQATAARRAREDAMVARANAEAAAPVPADRFPPPLEERRATAAKQAADALEERCARTLSDRETTAAAWVASRDAAFKLIDWDNEHCKCVDKGVPTTYQVEDSRGEVHTVRGMSTRYAERVCNAPRPKGLTSVCAERPMPAARPKMLDDTECRERDVAHSAVMRSFWDVD